MGISSLKSDKNPLKTQDLWKKEIIQEHTSLLEQDCSLFFRSDADPVGEGIAEMVPCVFCGSKHFLTLFHQKSYRWERCQSCGLLQKRPRPTLEAISRFYTEGKAVPFFEKNVLRADQKIRQEKILGPYLERLSLLVSQNNIDRGSLLDIGCSSGHFLSMVREKGLFSHYAGVEANQPSAREARKLGFKIYEGLFEHAELPEESYDVIVCFSMIQFVHEPVKFLKKCKGILRPGGFVIFTSPNGWAPDILLLQTSSPVLPEHMLQLPDPKSFTKICFRIGFSNVRVEAIGQLDVQLVQETWQEYPPDLSDPRTEFLYRLFVDLGSEDLTLDLQALLKKYNLSGHLWMEAQNP